MKFTKTSLAIITVLAFALPVAAAPPDPVNGFAVGTTNAGTLSYAIVSPRGTQAGSAPRIQYLNATSDKAASVVQFYKVLAQATVTHTNSTTTLFVNSTNTGHNWQSGTIIVRHVASDTYEKRTLAANTGSTNVVVTAAPYATIPGDVLYYASTTGAGTIPVGNATLSLNGAGSGIYVGQKDKPLLLEVDATTTGTINVVSGDYIK